MSKKPILNIDLLVYVTFSSRYIRSPDITGLRWIAPDETSSKLEQRSRGIVKDVRLNKMSLVIMSIEERMVLGNWTGNATIPCLHYYTESWIMIEIKEHSK